MEFDPKNPIVKLCLQGMAMEEQTKSEEAGKLFSDAWSQSTTDHDKFIAAFYVSRYQKNVTDKLKWHQTTLDLGLKLNDGSVKAALPSLYLSIGKLYDDLGDYINSAANYKLANELNEDPDDKGPFYHGTRADLKIGDLLTPGINSNYKNNLVMNHIYFTALPNGAGLAAALAKGEAHERVYIVEPTGKFENDPNVTNKKFPGNPTRSYRSSEPLKIVGELTDWVKQSPEDIKKWREKLASNTGEIIN